MAVLSLCDLTGNMVRPWAEAGHECFCVDVQHEQRRKVRGLSAWKVHGDVMKWRPWGRDDWRNGPWDFVIAQPPCTHLAGSGARWWAGKGLDPLIEALRLVQACVSIAIDSGAPWMLENPVGRLSTCWRKPDHKFDPWEYAGYGAPEDHYTKRTCLWTGGGFVMPPRRPLENGGLLPDKTRVHHQSPGSDRANRRSVAPMGFARAVYEANR